MKSLRLAFGFLTVLPVASADEAPVAVSRAWFPFVGLALGAALVGLDVPVRCVGRGSGGSATALLRLGLARDCCGGRRITGCCDADHDLGASFQEHRNRWHVVAGLVTAVLATALFLGAGGFILFGAAVVAALGLGRWMSGLLGGMTGDAYGAVNELCEVVVLILGVALVPLIPDVFQAPLW